MSRPLRLVPANALVAMTVPEVSWGLSRSLAGIVGGRVPRSPLIECLAESAVRTAAAKVKRSFLGSAERKSFSRNLVVVASPDGNLWFTENLGPAMGRLTP